MKRALVAIALLLAGCGGSGSGYSDGPAGPPSGTASLDTVSASDPSALQRPANLRRALAVLDRVRRQEKGVFEGLRIAPGRIDTLIRGRERSTDLRLSNRFTIVRRDRVPGRADQRSFGVGIRASDVDPAVPERMLAAIDRRRGGHSAGRDLNYFVIQRDGVGAPPTWSAYLQGAHPRYFSLQGGRLAARD